MDPFGQPPHGQGPHNQPPYGPPNQFPPNPNQFPPHGGPKPELPNATGVLVLGIVSLFFALLGCVFGPTVFISLITGIIGLAISGNAVRLNRENPMGFTGYGNVQAGRIMCIISLAIFALWVVIILIYLLFLGAAFSTAPWR